MIKIIKWLITTTVELIILAILGVVIGAFIWLILILFGFSYDIEGLLYFLRLSVIITWIISLFSALFKYIE